MASLEARDYGSSVHGPKPGHLFGRVCQSFNRPDLEALLGAFFPAPPPNPIGGVKKISGSQMSWGISLSFGKNRGGGWGGGVPRWKKGCLLAPN